MFTNELTRTVASYYVRGAKASALRAAEGEDRELATVLAVLLGMTAPT